MSGLGGPTSLNSVYRASLLDGARDTFLLVVSELAYLLYLRLSQGAGSLHFDFFLDSVFELTDLWTEEVDLDESNPNPNPNPKP